MNVRIGVLGPAPRQAQKATARSSGPNPYVRKAGLLTEGWSVFPPILAPSERNKSPPPIIVGNPDGWWNNLQDIPEQVGDGVNLLERAIVTRVSEEEAARCEAQYDNDLADCELVGPLVSENEKANCKREAKRVWLNCLAGKEGKPFKNYWDW